MHQTSKQDFYGSCVFCVPLDRYIGRHIDRLSTDVSVDISVDMSVDMSADICRSTYRPMYIGRVMVDVSTDYRQISRSI